MATEEDEGQGLIAAPEEPEGPGSGEERINDKGVGGRVGDWEVRVKPEGGRDLKDPRELKRFRGDVEAPLRPEDRTPNPIRDLWNQRGKPVETGKPLRMVDESCTSITPPLEIDNPVTGQVDRIATDTLPVRDDQRCTPTPDAQQYGDYPAPAGDEAEA